MNLSVCGIDCDACSFKLENKCEGCRISAPKGECVWGGRCDTHDCATGKGLPHCGKCTSFPCQQLQDIHKSENPEGNGIEIENLRALGGNHARPNNQKCKNGAIPEQKPQ